MRSLSLLVALALAACTDGGEKTPVGPADTTSVPDGAPNGPLVLTADGLGAIAASTPFHVDTVRALLPGFDVRPEQRSAEGMPHPVLVAYRGGTPAILITADTDGRRVRRVAVTSETVEGPAGRRVGQRFAEAGALQCLPGEEELSGNALCTDPAVPGVLYVFAHSWNGPDGELPPTDSLATAPMSQMVWVAPR